MKVPGEGRPFLDWSRRIEGTLAQPLCYLSAALDLGSSRFLLECLDELERRRFQLAFVLSTGTRPLGGHGRLQRRLSSDESVPGAGNMWSPLLCAAYHYDIGEYLAKSMCSRSAAALSQSCHFAVLVNPIERASMGPVLPHA